MNKALYCGFTILVVILCLFYLNGCSVIHDPLVVKVPIAIPCHRATLPPKPQLPIYGLSKLSLSPDVYRAYVKSIKLQDNYIDYLRKLLA